MILGIMQSRKKQLFGELFLKVTIVEDDIRSLGRLCSPDLSLISRT